MRFQRAHKPRRRGITPRRKAAAQKAVRKEADRFPLFPELRRWHTAEERIRDMDNQTVAYFQRLRDADAKRWRDARRRFRQLPAHDRDLVMRYWNRGHLPADAGYFADVVWQAERGKLQNTVKELEELDRLRQKHERTSNVTDT